jgi:hypothetical protein
MVKVNSGEPEPISIVGAAGATDIPFVVKAEADVPAEKGAASNATRKSLTGFLAATVFMLIV